MVAENIAKTILSKLKSLANPENVKGMARFGINPKKAYGISIPNLRKIAKEIRRNYKLADQPEAGQPLAEKLWSSGIHEAKILASMIDDPLLVTAKQMDRWICDFDSWDVCDEACLNLFIKIPCAYEKAMEWSMRKKEFEKRAGFALMATLAGRDKNAENEAPCGKAAGYPRNSPKHTTLLRQGFAGFSSPCLLRRSSRFGCEGWTSPQQATGYSAKENKKFLRFFPLIEKMATDERNYVKKAVNWALRQIGKRNKILKKEAVKTAQKIQKINSKSAKWIANDAIRELRNKKFK